MQARLSPQSLPLAAAGGCARFHPSTLDGEGAARPAGVLRHACVTQVRALLAGRSSFHCGGAK